MESANFILRSLSTRLCCFKKQGADVLSDSGIPKAVEAAIIIIVQKIESEKQADHDSPEKLSQRGDSRKQG